MIQFNKKKILITGGAGFIGSYIVRLLLKAGAKLTVLDDLSTGHLSNLSAHPDLHFVQDSVLNPSAFKSFRNFDFVFHLASVVGMTKAVREKSLTYDVLTIGTRNLLEKIEEAPVVLFSSSSVYGLTLNGSVHERTDIPFASLLEYDGGIPGYACGKFEMESMGLRAAEKGRRVMIVRPFNVIGPNQRSHYGMVVPRMIQQALQGEVLSVYGDGEQSRCFSCVRTFTQQLFRLIESGAPALWTAGSNVINLGSNTSVSINQLAQMVLEETGSTSSTRNTNYSEIFPGHQDVYSRIPDTHYSSRFLPPIEWPSVRDIIREILIASKIGIPDE